MRLILMIFCILGLSNIYANVEFEKIIDLEGTWKFEIGDNQNWQNPDFNDNHWEGLDVPSSWEDEGFPGFDGFAWYRIKFTLDLFEELYPIYLRLGVIDDCDEAYLNGQLIGFSGGMPPDFVTAAAEQRNYLIPITALNLHGENVLAVRVYDNYGPGGIKRGQVGIYINRAGFRPDIDMAGLWKFKTGDKPEWRNINIDDEKWDELYVPSIWDTQGYKDFDGIAWYRQSVYIPKKYRNKHLILALGKIDDFDDTYFNGQRIGHKGEIDNENAQKNLNNYWLQNREYYIPRDIIKFGAENEIAVRVFDGLQKGGIYEGPIGIVTRERYLRWREERRDSRDEFKGFFELLFGN